MTRFPKDRTWRPPEERSAAGRGAESAVCDHIEAQGFRVMARNFRGGDGEIDIVAMDGDTLAFVEVRFREEGRFGRPEETVTFAKRRRIASAARAYLAKIPPATWKEARFDVAAVEGGNPEGGGAPVIRYYRGAFDAKGKIL